MVFEFGKENVFDFLFLKSAVRPLFVAIPILIYFSLEYIRRIKKYYYTPVYFPFALETLNPAFAEYYGTNLMSSDVNNSPAREMALKRKAKVDGVIAIVISAYAIPLFVGFESALLLQESEFYLALILIAVTRFYQILRSVVDYDVNHTGFREKKKLVSILMYLYFMFSLYFMAKGYLDYRDYVIREEWWGSGSE